MTVIERLDKLLRERPLTRRGVEAALGLPLREDLRSTHPTLQIFRSFRAEPPIAKAELRLPIPRGEPGSTAKSFRSDAFLVLDVDQRADPVLPEELEPLFGELSPYGPKTPQRGPMYLEARTIRGPILFGYDRRGEHRLQKIIVDAV
jgi:hypothetical protein